MGVGGGGGGSLGHTGVWHKLAKMAWLSRTERMPPVRKKKPLQKPRKRRPPTCAPTPGRQPVRMGPTTFDAALSDWAHMQRQCLGSIPGCRSRLQAVFARGIDVTTHYSGTGAAEMAVAAVAECVSQKWKSDEEDFEGVKFHGCCDKSPICRRVLLNHPPESKADHCFEDLCSRPPERLTDQLGKLLLKYQRAAARASSPGCIGKQWVQAAMKVLQSWEPQRSDPAHCHCHGRACPAFPLRTSRYHLEVSGINCQPWSAAGKRQGWLDERSIPCLVLIRSILAVEPDGVCIECTPRFDFDTLADLLRPKYEGDFALTSPEDYGLPVARNRKYMWFDRRESLIETHARVRDLLNFTRRVPRLLPEAYLRAAPAELLRHYNKLLSAGVQAGKLSAPTSVPRRRKEKGPLVSQLRVRDVLHGGMLARYELYRKNLRGAGCHLVDLAKTPGYSRAPDSKRVPTLMKTSCLVALCDSEESDRLLLPSELPAIHGFELPAKVRDLPSSAVRGLIGNSMHAVQVGSFVLYALATRSFREGVAAE